MSTQLPRPSALRALRAFTLVELLAVMAVIGVVIAFAVPAANQIMRGSALTQGSQMLADSLSNARQLALSKNYPIEVRFYQFGDPETPGELFNDPETGFWRAFQVFEVLPNGATIPYGEMQRLPRGVVMEGDKFSTLISEDYRGKPIEAQTDGTAPEIPVEALGNRVQKFYRYISFRFLPDGSTDLPPRARKGANESGAGGTGDDTWFVTLIGLVEATNGVTDIHQVNYFTIQLDAVGGTLKTFRPTAG